MRDMGVARAASSRQGSGREACMTLRRTWFSVPLFAVALFASSSIEANTSVSYGKITAVKPVTVDDPRAQAGGALVGGAIGLISGRGQSGSNKALRTVAGGAAGQQVGRLAGS